jgi:hypothetical protein
MALPANLSQLTTAIKQTQDFANQAAAGDGQFLRYGKDGKWSFSSDDVEIEAGSQWAVNPLSIVTGFTAFDKDNNKQGEEMSALSEPPVSHADLPNVNAPWKPQVGITLKCVSGEDAGEQCKIYLCSTGGLKAMSGLIDEIGKKIDAQDEACVAVIELESSSYKHAKWGKIYEPVFTIVSWTTLNSEEFSEEEAAAEEAEAPQFEEVIEEETKAELPKSTRRRNRKVA